MNFITFYSVVQHDHQILRISSHSRPTAHTRAHTHLINRSLQERYFKWPRIVSSTTHILHMVKAFLCSLSPAEGTKKATLHLCPRPPIKPNWHLYVTDIMPTFRHYLSAY